MNIAEEKNYGFLQKTVGLMYRKQKLEKVNAHSFWLLVSNAISKNLPANPYVSNKSGTMLLLLYELFLGFYILLCNLHHDFCGHVWCNIVVVLQERVLRVFLRKLNFLHLLDFFNYCFKHIFRPFLNYSIIKYYQIAFGFSVLLLVFMEFCFSVKKLTN